MPLSSIVSFITSPSNSTLNTSTASVDLAANSLRRAIDVITPFAIQVIGAVVVFLIGIWIAGHIRKALVLTLGRSGHLDETLKSFLSSLVWYGLIALVAVTTLGVFGVPTTSFAAIIGATGLAIGLALQGTLGHIASGVMLLGFRPFEIGQYIETAGHVGTVRKLTLFTTELSTSDNKKIIIPNGEVWAGSIVNYSAYGERRVDLVFSVSYNDDLDRAMDAIRAVIKKEKRILLHKETAIAIDMLAEHSINIVCRPWVASSDYLDVKWALTKSIKEKFDSEGITIPFPTTTIIRENTESVDRVDDARN